MITILFLFSASVVLFPCDIELTRSIESATSGVKMDAKVSDVYLHLSATTCHIFLDVADMIMKDGQVSGILNTKNLLAFCFLWYSSLQINPVRMSLKGIKLVGPLIFTFFTIFCLQESEDLVDETLPGTMYHDLWHTRRITNEQWLQPEPGNIFTCKMHTIYTVKSLIRPPDPQMCWQGKVWLAGVKADILSFPMEALDLI